jgi:hypothetical protein
VRPVRRRHSRLRCAWSAYPTSTASPAVPSRTTPAAGRGAGLSQREKSLKSQRPLKNLRTHPHRVQAASTQLARGERQLAGQAVDVDRLPGHQRPYGFGHQPIHAGRTPKLLQQVDLQEHQRPLGRPGQRHRLDQAIRRTPPQLRQPQPLIHQIVQHRRKRRGRPRMEPHTHDRGVRRDDLDLRPGQRPDQLRPPTNRKVNLNPTRRQMPLQVRRSTRPLHPDRADHRRQPSQRRPLNVGLHPFIVAPHQPTRTALGIGHRGGRDTRPTTPTANAG